MPIDSYLPTNGQLDIQVQGIIGYEYGYVDVSGVPVTPRIITGESSDWSPTQTLTITDSSNSSTSTPSNEPSSPLTIQELSWIVPLPLLLFVFLVAVMVRHRKTRNQN